MGTVFRAGAAGAAAGEIAIGIAPDGIGCGFRYCSGAASNFFAHPAQQKKYLRPACSVLARADAGSTCIPQTGSRSISFCSAISRHAGLAFSPATAPDCHPEEIRLHL
jgi:hypothetical protein